MYNPKFKKFFSSLVIFSTLSVIGQSAITFADDDKDKSKISVDSAILPSALSIPPSIILGKIIADSVPAKKEFLSTNTVTSENLEDNTQGAFDDGKQNKTSEKNEESTVKSNNENSASQKDKNTKDSNKKDIKNDDEGKTEDDNISEDKTVRNQDSSSKGKNENSSDSSSFFSSKLGYFFIGCVFMGGIVGIVKLIKNYFRSKVSEFHVNDISSTINSEKAEVEKSNNGDCLDKSCDKKTIVEIFWKKVNSDVFAKNSTDLKNDPNHFLNVAINKKYAEDIEKEFNDERHFNSKIFYSNFINCLVLHAEFFISSIQKTTESVVENWSAEDKERFAENIARVEIGYLKEIIFMANVVLKEKSIFAKVYKYIREIHRSGCGLITDVHSIRSFLVSKLSSQKLKGDLKKKCAKIKVHLSDEINKTFKSPIFKKFYDKSVLRNAKDVFEGYFSGPCGSLQRVDNCSA